MSTSSTTIAIVVALAILWLTLFPRVVGSTSPIAASETTLDGNRTDEDVLSSYLAGVQFSEVSWNLDFTEPNMPLFRFFRTRSPSFIDVSSVQRATIAMMRISTKNQTWVFKPLLYIFFEFSSFSGSIRLFLQSKFQARKTWRQNFAFFCCGWWGWHQFHRCLHGKLHANLQDCVLGNVRIECVAFGADRCSGRLVAVDGVQAPDKECIHRHWLRCRCKWGLRRQWLRCKWWLRPRVICCFSIVNLQINR